MAEATGSIHVLAVNSVQDISTGVQALYTEIREKSKEVGKPGGMSPEQFQAWMLDMELRLNMLKKALDAIEQSAKSFHRP
ncbi:MAG: hypothetical protein HY692_00525 [Cyanobacteria bacterium NC_groundwater_1444_Ag_S-0.65um_54_12]|nr:hypothetical protein [Cyanobacteria bacterium NC_groundwater_1444_Ag_S-0.65um_54_12]